jgi:predicted esterase
MASARERHLAVTRTARYHTLGEPSVALRDVWFVLHGHSQLSAYFIRNFAGLDDGTRLIIAPEALNRFYVEPTTFHGAGQARVGATWMTKEDRLAEIADYVGYLDQLYDEVFAELDRASVRAVVLGFSQGAQTACRWLCQGRARADTLVLWAGPVAAELTHETSAPLRAMTVLRVLGNSDEMAAPGFLAAENARVAALGLGTELIEFDGGHQMNLAVLRSLKV